MSTTKKHCPYCVEEMKHCPYCGEEIHDQAIKCRFCGQWLETAIDMSRQSIPANQPQELVKHMQAVSSQPIITAPTPIPTTYPVPIPVIIETLLMLTAPTRIPTTCPDPVSAITETLDISETLTATETLNETDIKPELKVHAFRRGRRCLGYLELLMWGLVPAAAVLAIDALSGMVSGRESVMTETDWFFFYALLMIAYGSLGLALSGLVYRLSVLGITAISLVTLLGVRMIIVPYGLPGLVTSSTNMRLGLAIAAFNGLFAWACISLAIGAGVLALRLTETELQFAEALDGGNPVKALLRGLAETGLGVFSFCGWSMIHEQLPGSMSSEAFAALLPVLIIADGVRRAFAAAKVYTGIYDRYYDAARPVNPFTPDPTASPSSEAARNGFEGKGRKRRLRSASVNLA